MRDCQVPSLTKADSTVVVTTLLQRTSVEGGESGTQLWEPVGLSSLSSHLRGRLCVPSFTILFSDVPLPPLFSHGFPFRVHAPFTQHLCGAAQWRVVRARTVSTVMMWVALPCVHG